MRKLIHASPSLLWLALPYGSAHATTAPSVPEIDGGMAAIAIGLTLGVVALIREHRRKK